MLSMVNVSALSSTFFQLEQKSLKFQHWEASFASQCWMSNLLAFFVKKTFENCRNVKHVVLFSLLGGSILYVWGEMCLLLHSRECPVINSSQKVFKKLLETAVPVPFLKVPGTAVSSHFLVTSCHLERVETPGMFNISILAFVHKTGENRKNGNICGSKCRYNHIYIYTQT